MKKKERYGNKRFLFFEKSAKIYKLNYNLGDNI